MLSVAANWLHTWLPAATMPDGWHPGVAPQIGSAVWPIGLLLSVEVLSRTRWRRGMAWILGRYLGAGSVAIGSAIISYRHVYDVLTAWDYGHLGAAVGPVVLDGLMVISGFALLSESAVTTTMTATQGCDPVSTQADSPASAADSPSDIDRDALIRATYAQINSTREVGEVFGLHHSTIARIVAAGSNRDRTCVAAEPLDVTDGSERYDMRSD
ncbi:hypothetical protein [Nocardia brasiliensis]|uniref:hypothetical protein n=2 Tax=Nocardia brasiliensis TaxID=37326 RepID=UPI0024552DF9|nr:hypothetical protein [Nocardia brasiliensis]